ncbi:MAG: hypothetical protein H7Y04_10085 [Verrucomicrobia bacterium]|nr:hypothetical protein [Cytophagales bacterium]
MRAESYPDSPFSFEEIEQYNEKQLTAEQEQIFKQKLIAQSAAQESLQVYQTITQGIKAVQRKHLLLQLAEEEEAMPAFETPKKNKTVFFVISTQKMYWAAASLLLMAVVGFYFFSQSQKLDQLFSQYFSPHTEDSIPLASDVLSHYHNHDYPLVVKKLEAQSDSVYTAELFYKGNAYLGLRDAPNAIVCFEEIAQKIGNPYQKDSEWYLALSYIEAKNPKKAKLVLEKIVADNTHPHYQKALSLFNKL